MTYDDTGTARYLCFTDGEKAIWAAAFVRYAYSSATAAMTIEEGARVAAHRAHDAVIIARKLAVGLRDDDSEAAFMAHQMVNHRRADEKQDDEVRDVLEWLHHNRFVETEKLFLQEAGIECDEKVKEEQPT